MPLHPCDVIERAKKRREQRADRFVGLRCQRIASWSQWRRRVYYEGPNGQGKARALSGFWRSHRSPPRHLSGVAGDDREDGLGRADLPGARQALRPVRQPPSRCGSPRGLAADAARRARRARLHGSCSVLRPSLRGRTRLGRCTTRPPAKLEGDRRSGARGVLHGGAATAGSCVAVWGGSRGAVARATPSEASRVNDEALSEDPAPELAPVRPGEQLDWRVLEAWLIPRLAEVLPGVAPPIEILQFPNGSANLTYLLRVGEHELVLRRPPMGEIAPGAHDMKREHKVLSRLWRQFDRAPRAYVFCSDHAVLGADFFVMERRRGEVVRDAVPRSMAEHPDVGRRIGFALVDAMAELHGLDPADVRSRGPRQARWLRRTAGERAGRSDGRSSVRRLAAGDGCGAPARSSEHARVEPRVHRPQRPQARQLPVRPGDPDRVESIFDWDMTTLGDPLIDLGTLLNYWPDPADPPSARRASHQGLADDGLADAGRDHRALRRRAPASTVGHPLVRGVRARGRRRWWSSSCTAAGCAERAPIRGWRASPTACPR